MNLFKQLFRHHPHSESSTETASYDWPGQSGKTYHYEVFPFDAEFQPLPGNYIYAKQLTGGEWSPIYIAQTRDLHQRLEGHVSVNDAIENGATHLHAHYDQVGRAARCGEEHDLVKRWCPVCNDVY